jgi:hypothetical protein
MTLTSKSRVDGNPRRRRHADTRHPIDFQSGLRASLSGLLSPDTPIHFAITSLGISCALISA